MKTSDFELAALAEARNYQGAILRMFSPYLKGNVLEIGAGTGNLSAGLHRQPGVTRLVAVEPDAEFCRQLHHRLPRVELVHGTIDAVTPDAPWNALISVNVLEHIREDEAELAKYGRVLRSAHGYLCLFVPARQEIYAALDRDFGHCRRYHRPGLRRILEQAGFRVIQLHYYNLLGYFLWGLNFRLLRRRAIRPGAVRLFDCCLLPLVDAVESRGLRPPLGQSLVAVAQAI
jgi:SAM-dependent methyltransferase